MAATRVPLADAMTFDVVTHKPTTGGISDADSLPTFAVFKDDSDTPILSGTMVKRVGLTGNYRGTFTASTANGFVIDSYYNIIVTATVTFVTAKRVPITFRVDTATVSTGSGSVSVDHDYGGTDALAYSVGGGAAVEDAIVQAFLTSDYTAGNRDRSYVKGETRTNAYGRWDDTMRLDPAAYTIVFYKPNEYGPDTTAVTVT